MYFISLQDDLEFITTQRGALCLILNQNRFRKDRALNETTSWRCCSPGCKSRCKTDPAHKVLLAGPSIHNHDPPQQATLDLERARTCVKKKAAEVPEQKPNKIVCQETAKYKSLSYKYVSALTKVFHYKRKSKQPPLPSKLEDVFPSIAKFDFSSLNGLDLLVNDQTNKLIMLGSAMGLKHLTDSEHVLGDGTFKYCTKYFEQLYTFHGYGANKVYVPCVYFLVTNKTEHTYILMLNYMQEVSRNLVISLIPMNVHVDLEMDMIKAIKNCYPRASIRRCQFNVSQSWFRKLQSLGLASDYNTSDSVIGNWLKLFFGLPALPPNQAQDFFFDIMVNTNPDIHQTLIFSTYLEKNYMLEDSLYPPNMWAHVDEKMPTTTNACEAFHKSLEHSFTSHHQALWSFLITSSEQNQKSDLKIRNDDALPIKKSRRQLKEWKTELRRKYFNFQISEYDFVKTMSFRMLPVQNH